MNDVHQAVAAYWAAERAGTGTLSLGLVAEYVVYEAPQFRGRVRGGAVRTCGSTVEGFPGDWHLNVERIVGEGRHTASWLEFSDAGHNYPGVCFFDFDEDG